MKRNGMQFNLAGAFLSCLFCTMLLCSSEVLASSNRLMEKLPPLSSIDSSIEQGIKFDTSRVMHVPAASIPQAFGEPVSSLRLYAVRENELEEIRLQVKEFNIEGFPYFASVNIPVDGETSIFDASDELMFMLSDAGDRWHARLPNMPILAELLIKTEEGARYVYLTRQKEASRFSAWPPLVSIESFGATDVGNPSSTATGVFIQGASYSFRLNERDADIWSDIQFHSSRPNNNISNVEKTSLKLQVQLKDDARLVPKQYIRARLLDMSTGPLSTTLLLSVNLMTASFPVVKSLVYMEALPQEISLHARAAISDQANSFVINPSVQFGLVEHQGLMAEESRIEWPQSIFGVQEHWFWLNMMPSIELFSYLKAPESLLRSVDLIRNIPYRGQLDTDRLAVGYAFNDLQEGEVIKFKTHFLAREELGHDRFRFARQILNKPSILNLGDEVVSFFQAMSELRVSSRL